jgi:hypothetical protein
LDLSDNSKANNYNIADILEQADEVDEVFLQVSTFYSRSVSSQT